MNRHTARLMVAIGAAWVIGALASTPLVSYRFYVLVFVAVFAVPGVILLWHKHYRIGWLALALTAGTFVGWFNMFSFSSSVLAVDGERMHATVAEVVEHERSDGGHDIECVLRRPNGARIPGALVAADGCRETEDVLVSRHGLVDPIRVEDAPDGADLAGPIGGQLCPLIFTLALCVRAAWPHTPPPPGPPADA